MQGSPKSPKSGEGGFSAVDSAAGAVVGSGPSMDAPTAPAVGSFNADVSVPEVPAVRADLAGKLPSSAAEMSVAGDVAVDVPEATVPKASGEMEMPAPLPAAGDISVGESWCWRNYSMQPAGAINGGGALFVVCGLCWGFFVDVSLFFLLETSCCVNWCGVLVCLLLLLLLGATWGFHAGGYV